VEEQLIMSRTGHRSFQGVRAYKRVSADQKQALSSILNSTTNGEEPTTVTKKPKVELTELDSTADAAKENTTSLDLGLDLTQKKLTFGLPSMNFSGCSSVTINISK
jgi:hypothetical protein